MNEPLVKYFDEILVHFKEIYVHGKKPSYLYLGDNLMDFLGREPGTYMVSNPWHEISVKYSAEEKVWVVYDPNYVNGPLKVQPQELRNELERILGKLFSVANVTTDIKPAIHDADAFLRDGVY